MTDIAFHYGAPNKLGYAGRLVRKALASGARLTIVATPAQVHHLDASLWALRPTDFLVHTIDDGQPLHPHCPVVLATHLHAGLHGHQVLVNLANTVPEGFAQFERLIEVVSLDEADRTLARQRWRQYSQQGYPLQRKDLALREAP